MMFWQIFLIVYIVLRGFFRCAKFMDNEASGLNAAGIAFFLFAYAVEVIGILLVLYWAGAMTRLVG